MAEEINNNEEVRIGVKDWSFRLPLWCKRWWSR